MLLTRPPLAARVAPALPLDLHVLGLPPAFNLSHDQTLQFKQFANFKSQHILAQWISLNKLSSKLSIDIHFIDTNVSAHTIYLIVLLNSFRLQTEAHII